MYGRATQNAIAAAGRLAEVYDDGVTRLSAADIAESRGLQKPFVSKLLSAMAVAGLVNGTRGPGGGSGCPPETRQAIRVTWEGGITKPGGKEVGDKERLLYKVIVLDGDGTKAEVTPFAIADMGDSDNNHRLCLDVDGAPLSVSFPAGHLTDPREDLNPKTTIAITPKERPARTNQ